MAVETRPVVQLTESPEITIGDINDITGTIADKDRKVIQRVASSFSYNQVTVGTSAVQLATSSTPLKFGIVVKADPSNSGKVYVGDSSVSTSNGYLLTAGEGIAFEIDDASKVYVVADTDNQKVYWLGV